MKEEAVGMMETEGQLFVFSPFLPLNCRRQEDRRIDRQIQLRSDLMM